MEHQLTCSRGSIDPFLWADQIDLPAFELIDGFQQFLERSSKGRQPSREDKRNLQFDPLAVHVTARVGLHHPVRGFRLAFWCRRAPNCTTYCTSGPPESEKNE